MQTMADHIRLGGVRSDSLTRSILLVAGGSMLVTLCAKIQIPMWPVPFSMQPFAVLLVGAVLGSRRGAAALLAYSGPGCDRSAGLHRARSGYCLLCWNDGRLSACLSARGIRCWPFGRTRLGSPIFDSMRGVRAGAVDDPDVGNAVAECVCRAGKGVLHRVRAIPAG